jgi:hypothetical protein
MDPTTPDTPTETVTQNVPGLLGRLTPEEAQSLMSIRQESQQLLQKVGEHEVLKARVMLRIDALDAKGQEIINSISQRVGVPDGQQWVALQDGTIRLVNNAPAQESAEPS